MPDRLIMKKCWIEIEGFDCPSSSNYDYKGYLFEWHSYFGPLHLRRSDFAIRINQSNKFFEAVERWQKLTKKKRETYRVELY